MFNIFRNFFRMALSEEDIQFMAINGLIAELQKHNVNLDLESEEELVRALLKLLDDPHFEIRNLALKCLGLLVNKVAECYIEEIVNTLCFNMASDKEQLRDISGIGLKTIIAEIPQDLDDFSAYICNIITDHLTSVIELQEDVSVQIDALDIIIELLLRFGLVIEPYHEAILPIVLRRLCSQSQAVRKRAVSACSYFMLCCNNSLYTKLIDHLFDGLCSDKHNFQTQTFVQCIAFICRQSGDKFGKHVQKFVPLILQCSYVDDDDELRELCLSVFESFISIFPKEIARNVPPIIDVCLECMVYDPNYNDDEQEEEDSEYNNNDDDDISWKVRKSAAKCLKAIISTGYELLPGFYKAVSPVLISQFNKENEKIVKSEIFHAYIALLNEAQSTVDGNTDHNGNVMYEGKETPMTLMQHQIELLVKEVQGQLKVRSMDKRQDCLQLLKQVCTVVRGAFSNHIGDIIPGVLYSLSDKNSSKNMKADALSFVYCLLTSHQHEVFHPHISILLPAVIGAVGDNFFKITVEAMNVLEQLVEVIRPLNIICDFDFTPFIKNIYSCTFLRITTAVDHEVREKAISTMGQVVCNLGDHLKSELPFCLLLLLDRLKNETTRLTTVKAFTKIAGSPLSIGVSILPHVMPILGPLLRKNQRALKLSTLHLIDCLVKNYRRDLTVQLLHPFTVEVPRLLHESDLDVARWTVIILKSVAIHHPRALQDINNIIMPKVLLLVKFPLLEGMDLQSIIALIKF